MSAFRRILYPTDFSPASRAAFEVARSLAWDNGAELIVLHVYPPPTFHGEVIAYRQPDGYAEQLRDELRQACPPGPVLKTGYLVEEGDPAAVILDLAATAKCDLIVVGTHGRTGLGRLLMGSVAERVMRRSPCPVLTVRAPLAAAESPEAEPATAGGR